MPSFRIPNSATLHALRAFLQRNDFFSADPDPAELELHPRWAHAEPLVIAMAAAWGAWSLRNGYRIVLRNPESGAAAYLARMELFRILDLAFPDRFQRHEEAGRFLPVRQVRERSQIQAVIADISALLHLEHEPETLAAVRYCVSELLRNVLEHANSPEGAFVCAQNFPHSSTPRVSIAVADCGEGISAHLGRVREEARTSAGSAIRLAMQPGVTGALPGIYGTPDNAGAGLFITRSIAKGSGGYFALISGDSAYRLYRARNDDEKVELFADPLEERHNLWELDNPWRGTAVAVEVRTDQIGDFEGYFQWIRKLVPPRTDSTRRILFT